MTRIVVGVGSERRGWEAIRYGAGLARQLGAELLLAHVHPRPWTVHGQGDVDAEWLAYLQQESQALLTGAVAQVEPDVPVTVHSHTDSGAGRGLMHVAEEHDAELIVIGSGQDRPGDGPVEAPRLHLGSTADHLLHSAGVPVAVVPGGWSTAPRGPVGRVSVGWHGGAGTRAALAAGCALAERAGVDLRLVAFLAGPPAELSDAEGAAGRLRAGVVSQLTGTAEGVRERYGLRVEISTEAGASLREAVVATQWGQQDLLVIGSSGAGVLRRAFLGDAAGKILRAVGVPTVTVPRAAT